MPLDFDSFDHTPRPDQLESIYTSGFKGTLADETGALRLAAETPAIHSAFPEAVGLGKGKLLCPYKWALSLDEDYGRCEPQTTGDCVSHSTRNAGMLDYCADALFGETEYKGRLATEPIYGARQHGGQGASCSLLAEYVGPEGVGGFLPRAKYQTGDDAVDLSTYDSRKGHRWGRRGTPSWLSKLARKNSAGQVYRVDSLDDARDALALGLGLSRCGWWGYSNRRNEDGVSERSGRWAHAMAIIGCDDTTWANDKYDGALWLVQNSWGEWNSGGKRHEQPDGSFWVRSKWFKAEVAEGGVYAIGAVRGYDRELIYGQADKLQEIE